MKKIIALLMTLALVISAVALPVLAEETAGTVDEVTSATQNSQNSQNSQTAKGGRGGNRQMPGQNGQMPGNKQMPGQNGQNSQAPGSGVMPQMPGQNSQNGQMPDGKNGRQGKGAAGRNGQAVRGGKQLIFDQLLSEGVITQEIYDAITAWMNEKMQPQANAAAPAEGTEPPTLQEGANTDTDNAQLLKSLLDSGAITQEQYDRLSGAQQPAPAASAAN